MTRRRCEAQSPPALLLAIALLSAAVPADTALAVECRAAPINDGSYWQWRQIDGRRCWFPGKRKLEKAELHWEAKPIQRPPQTASAAGDGGHSRRTLLPASVTLQPFAENAQPAPKIVARWEDDQLPAQVIRTVQYLPPQQPTTTSSWFVVICCAWLAALVAAWGAHAIFSRSTR